MSKKWIAIALAGLGFVVLGASAAQASFWAEPFPHGYRPWGPCIRYERFDTEGGPVFRRISVCGPYYGRHFKTLRVRG